MTRADKTELALYRGGILRQKLNRHHLTIACKHVSRHVATLARVNLESCNGVPKSYDAQRREWNMGLDENDKQKHEKLITNSRAAILDALKPFLTPGCRFKWYTDPRANCVLRISTRDNRKDAFL